MMRLNFRLLSWVFGGLVGLGISTAAAQQPVTAYYYPAPGFYATTRGTVQITKAGYYLNVPLNAVPASRLASTALRSGNSNPAQGYNGSGYQARAMIPGGAVRSVSMATYDGEPDPGWQFRE